MALVERGVTSAVASVWMAKICRVGCEQIVVLFLVLRCIREIFFFLFDSFCQILQLDLDIFLLFQVFFFLFQVLIGVLDLAGTRGELLTQFLRSPLRLLDRQGRSGASPIQ